MRWAEILDAQEDGKYGRGKLGSDLPKVLQRREERLEAISRARKALEAEAAAAAARDRARKAAAAEAPVADAEETGAEDREQQKLRDKAAKAQEKAEAAREQAIEKAKEAGLAPLGLEPQPANAMPRLGAAKRRIGYPQASSLEQQIVNQQGVLVDHLWLVDPHRLHRLVHRGCKAPRIRSNRLREAP